MANTYFLPTRILDQWYHLLQSVSANSRPIHRSLNEALSGSERKDENEETGQSDISNIRARIYIKHRSLLVHFPRCSIWYRTQFALEELRFGLPMRMRFRSEKKKNGQMSIGWNAARGITVSKPWIKKRHWSTGTTLDDLYLTTALNSRLLLSCLSSNTFALSTRVWMRTAWRKKKRVVSIQSPRTGLLTEDSSVVSLATQ